jgi:hypothetical protein
MNEYNGLMSGKSVKEPENNSIGSLSTMVHTQVN